jgi:hypothetical protein
MEVAMLRVLPIQAWQLAFLVRAATSVLMVSENTDLKQHHLRTTEVVLRIGLHAPTVDLQLVPPTPISQWHFQDFLVLADHCCVSNST